MGRISPQRWLGIAVFPIIGFVLLWWANQQMADMLGSQIGLAPWGSVLGWLFTVTLSGVMFGLAVALSQGDRSRLHGGAVLLAAVAPFAVVVHFFGFLALGWSPLGLDVFGVFLITPATAMVSSVVLGFLLVAFFAPRLIRSD